MKCNSDKCHCSACTASKIEKLDERVTTLEDNEGKHTYRAEAMLRQMRREEFRHRRVAVDASRDNAISKHRALMEEQRGVAWKDRIFWSKNSQCYWRWQHLSEHNWRRAKCSRSGALLDGFEGPSYSHVEFFPNGFRAQYKDTKSPRWRWEHGRPGSHHAVTMGASENVPLFRVDIGDPVNIEITPEARDAYRTAVANANMAKIPEWAAGLPLTGEKTMLAALEISILVFKSAHPTETYPVSVHDTTGSRLNAFERLRCLGLLEFNNQLGGYSLTERAKVFLNEGVFKVPLPVQQSAPWIMPKS